MDHRRLLLGYALALSFVACGPAAAPPVAAPKHDDSIEQAAARVLLEHLTSELREHYAPLEMKKAKGWKLERQIHAVNAVIDEPGTTTAELQTAFRRLFDSLDDLHSSVFLKGDRAVWLGFHALVTDSGVRVAWAMPGSPVTVGDEIVSFDGEPIATEMSRVARDYGRRSTADFDRAFNEWFLTMRASSDLKIVPKKGDVVELGLRRGKVRVSWEELPDVAGVPFWPRSRRSVLPFPADVTWRAPDDAIWPSYAFRAGGRRYGFIRLHTYHLPKAVHETAIQHFDRAIDAFADTDGLIIDQRGNGGGNFLLGYTMFSRVFDRPLVPVKQRYLVRGDYVVGFGNKRDLLDPQQTAPIVEELFGFGPKPDPTFFQFFASQNDGLTAPHFSLVSSFPPRGQPYRKPIVMLVDGMALSAGDFVPATLKDNGRVTLFGTTTAGAGGDQRFIGDDDVCPAGGHEPLIAMCAPPLIVKAMQTLGIAGYSLTVTLGVRANGELIENKGARPDIEYRITAEDLTTNFGPMWAKVLGALP